MSGETTMLIKSNTVPGEESIYMKLKSLKEVNRAKLSSYLEKLIEVQQIEDELSVDLETRRKKHSEAIQEALSTLEEIQCSFCGKTKSEVSKIVTAPSGACICDECIAICKDIIDQPDDL